MVGAVTQGDDFGAERGEALDEDDAINQQRVGISGFCVARGGGDHTEMPCLTIAPCNIKLPSRDAVSNPNKYSVCRSNKIVGQRIPAD